MTDFIKDGLALVEDDLAGIEIALEQNLTPYLEVVRKTARHIMFSGGKRLRPLLMVLSARICGYKGDYDKTFSVIFEYLHTASLLHDDLVDEATVRRGKPVANSIYGNSIAVLVGDFLLARVLSIASRTGRMRIIKAIAEITENMSQGEIHQLINKGKLDLSEEEYMEVIRRKTAVLIEGACRTGAIIAGASEKKEKALAGYGLNIGLAFQMADDLLDYISDTKVLGKEIGADLKEGKLTLPVIHALQNTEPQDRALMEKIITNDNFSNQDFKKLKDLLKTYKGLDYTRSRAKFHIKAAIDSIAPIGNSQSKDLLLMLAEYVLTRKM